MPSYLADATDRFSGRFRQLASGPSAPRGDLAAAAAVVAVLALLGFAQLTLVLLIAFLVIGRLSRWRPSWLAVPAVLGLAWLLAIGLPHGATGYLAGASRLLDALARHGTLAARLRQVRLVLAHWGRWLPGQLPAGLVVAAVAAAALELAGRPRRTWSYRPGALVAARSWYLSATLRRGELATADGCCVGIVRSVGSRVSISWQEAAGGVLCTGSEPAAAAATGRDLALAAIQHRKSVIIIDLAGPAGWRCPDDADPAGLAEVIGAACAELAAPLDRVTGQLGRYDPLSGASPARATSLILAMLEWTGAAHGRQVLCSNYLNTALTLIAARPAAAPDGPAELIAELISLLAPGALTARVTAWRQQSRTADLLAPRVAELAAQLDADPALLAPVAAQLADLSLVLSARRPARQDADGSVTLPRMLARRAVLLFELGRPLPAQPAAMIARLVVADLVQILAERSDEGAAADCLIWINGCAAVDARQLGALTALGARTKAAVVLSTSAGPVAAGLVADANVIAVRGAGPADRHTDLVKPPHQGSGDEAGELRRWLRGTDRQDALTVRVSRPRQRVVEDCQVVR
jgi:hypothetical protein